MIKNAIICTTFPSKRKNDEVKVKFVPCSVNLKTLGVKIDKIAEDYLFAPLDGYLEPNSLYCEIGNQFCTVAGGQNERFLDDDCEGFHGFIEEINNPTSNLNKIQLLKAELFVNNFKKENNFKSLDSLRKNDSFYIDDEQTVINASTLSDLTTHFSKLSIINENEAKQLQDTAKIFNNISERLSESRKQIINDNKLLYKRKQEILSEFDSILFSDFSITDRYVNIFDVSTKLIKDCLDKLILFLEQKEIKYTFIDSKKKLIFIDPSLEYDLRDIICEEMKDVNTDLNLKSYIQRNSLFSHDTKSIKLLYS